MSTVGGVQYRGDIMSTVGGYHEYRGGCSVPWGTQITKDFSPTVLNTLTVLMISPTCIMISPHGTEHPHGTQDNPPRYS